MLGVKTDCWAGRHTGCEPEKKGGGQIIKAFVICEKSLRNSFHGETIQSHLLCRNMAVAIAGKMDSTWGKQEAGNRTENFSQR